MTAIFDIGEPNPRQIEFFRARARHIAYGGARGGGKSWAARKKSCGLCLSYPQLRVLLVRRTLPELKENHLMPLQQELHGIAQYRDADKSFTFPNGSRLKLGYCDSESDIYQYQGQEYDAIFMEEATHFTEVQQQFLTTCNRSTRMDFTPRMYYTCNPGNVGHAWVKRLFIDRDYREGENPDDYLFIPAKVWDNKALMDANPEYVRTLQALPPEMRRAHLNGDWNVFAGQYFSLWDENIHVCEPFNIPDHWLRMRAIDYGFDRLACLWAAADENGNVYIYNEYCVSDRIISDAAHDILDRSSGREMCTFAPTDLSSRSRETGVPRTETFARNGLPLTLVKNGRIPGWQNVLEWLKPINGTPRLRIFNNCRELIHCLPLLQHDEKNPEDCATEPHNITHAPDALRYMLDGRPQATQLSPPERAPWEPMTPEDEMDAFLAFGR